MVHYKKIEGYRDDNKVISRVKTLAEFDVTFIVKNGVLTTKDST